MKLTLILLTAGFLNVAAKGLSQNISFSGKHAPLKSVFSSIEKQTDFVFMYSGTVLQSSRPVTISAQNVDLTQFLSEIFKSQPLQYNIKGKNIFVSPKPSAVHFSKQEKDDPYSIIRVKIADEDGQPLAGASVSVKNSRSAGVSDAEGIFNLDISNGDIVVVSFVGYQSKEIKVSASQISSGILSITLSRLSTQLDETVVVAYGTTTKRLSTGNVNSVNGADIEKQPVSNPLLALEGRVPGLFITQSNGLPGSGVTALIQGRNSINKGNDPFYLVDGVPFTSQLLPGFGGILGSSGVNTASSGSPLNYLNPSDIESVTVLKDADATAIYGSRAANGAIIITTKKGKAGHSRVSLNVQNGWGKVTRKIDLLNTAQYMEMRHEAIALDETTTQPSDFDINGVWDSTRYTDWQKKLIGGTANYTNVNASVSGGNANSQYLIGTTFKRETTVFPGSFADKKGAVHFSINSLSENKKFSIQFSGNYLIDDNRLPASDLTRLSLILPPNAPSLYNSDGSINWDLDADGNSRWQTWAGNPMAQQLVTYKNKTSNLSGNAILAYEIIPGLKIQSSFGYNNLQTNETVLIPLASVEPAFRPFSLRESDFADNNINSWIIEPQLLYKRNFNFGRVDVLIGTTLQRINSSANQIGSTGYNTDDMMENINAASSVYSAGAAESEYRYNALFGRLNYSVKDKYIVSLNARRDGSSRFGSANQFNNFGSVGAAWIFTEEPFMQSAFNKLSFGKLKGSYGTTGSDQIGEYGFLNLYSNTSSSTIYQGASGLIPNGLTNPFLQWEESTKLNAGIDLGLFSDRILLNVNFFRNRSSNQLVAYRLPYITGFQSITKNFPATVQNMGWEFSLNTTNIRKKDFQWNTNFTLTIHRNKLIKYDNIDSSSDAARFKIGQPITITGTYHLVGVDPQTGVYQFASEHGPTPTPNPVTDNIYFINKAPAFYGGLENSISYKGFNLSFLFSFVKQKGQGYTYGLNDPGTKNNQPVTVLKRWTHPGQVAPIQRFNSDYTWASQSDRVNASDASYENASYIRLKNISLAWTTPATWNKKLRVNNINLYLQGQNMLTITRYSGLDPETLSIATLPPLRMFTVGIQVTL